MSPGRPRHPKTDANQAEFVDVLRAHGFWVAVVSDVGRTCLDLFVMAWHRDRRRPEWLHVEVKRGPREKLTPGEAEAFRQMRALFGPAVPAIVAWEPEQVFAWYGYP